MGPAPGAIANQGRRFLLQAAADTLSPNLEPTATKPAAGAAVTTSVEPPLPNIINTPTPSGLIIPQVIGSTTPVTMEGSAETAPTTTTPAEGTPAGGAAGGAAGAATAAAAGSQGDAAAGDSNLTGPEDAAAAGGEGEAAAETGSGAEATVEGAAAGSENDAAAAGGAAKAPAGGEGKAAGKKGGTAPAGVEGAAPDEGAGEVASNREGAGPSEGEGAAPRDGEGDIPGGALVPAGGSSDDASPDGGIIIVGAPGEDDGSGDVGVLGPLGGSDDGEVIGEDNGLPIIGAGAMDGPHPLPHHRNGSKGGGLGGEDIGATLGEIISAIEEKMSGGLTGNGTEVVLPCASVTINATACLGGGIKGILPGSDITTPGDGEGDGEGEDVGSAGTAIGLPPGDGSANETATPSQTVDGGFIDDSGVIGIPVSKGGDSGMTNATARSPELVIPPSMPALEAGPANITQREQAPPSLPIYINDSRGMGGLTGDQQGKLTSGVTGTVVSLRAAVLAAVVAAAWVVW